MSSELSNSGEPTINENKSAVLKKTAFDWDKFDDRIDALNDLRERHDFVDLMLVSNDGGIEISHLTVISTLGKKITAIIEQSMDSPKTETIQLDNGFVVKKVLLRGFTKAVLKSVVDCTYTGLLKINSEIIWDLIECAQFYEMPHILNASLILLIRQMDVKNCIQVFDLGRKHKHMCAEAAYSFIRTYFPKIVEYNVHFTSLTIQELMDLIKDDELNVIKENIVWNAIIRWVEFDVNNRETYLKSILSELRFARIDFSFICDNILTNDLIKGNVEYSRIVNNFIKGYEKQSSRKDGYGIYVGLSPISVRPRIPHEVLLAFGGWQEGVPTNLIESYDIRTNRWYTSKLTNNFPRAYHGIEVINGLIYVIGGTNGTDILRTVHSFNPINKKWYELMPLIEQRCYVSTVSICGNIYAMGGHNGHQRIRTCETYDVITNEWIKFQDMNMSRSDASAAVHQNNIYIAGGLNNQLIENTVEVYNRMDKTWTFIQPMSSPRTSLALVAYNQSLYAIGGNNGFERLQSAERYDFRLKTWVAIAGMKSKRSTFSACVIQEELFVVGGHNGQTPICLVEKYSHVTKVWSDVRSIKHDRSGLAVCVLKGISNAVDYTYIGNKTKKGNKDITDFSIESTDEESNDELS